MSAPIVCPSCGAHLRKGSTFCLKCGAKLSNAKKSPTTDETLDVLAESPLDDVEESKDDEPTLPDLDEWVEEEDPLVKETLAELKRTEESTESPHATPADTPSDSVLSWEEGLAVDSDEKEERQELPADRDESMVWESPPTSSDVKEGMPFKEIEPPIVHDEAIMHASSDALDTETHEAVDHLFPHGRGETTEDFIDAVVGKPTKIGSDVSPSMIETPTCPECGARLGTNSFEYPAYVYEAMGKARIEHGIELMKDTEHEKAIEQFEIAKRLFEHAENEKMVEEATKYVDDGYDSMAEHHYVQGENHLKEKQFDWSIVQFKKARELYMFSTDAKKRMKCSQRARDAYEEWGKTLEDEGDRLAKAGQTREALAKYSEAAEKYREADASKRLRGLEKKIRTA
jgi:hypothetical protein